MAKLNESNFLGGSIYSDSHSLSSWQQDHEVAGPITSAVRKQREINAGLSALSSLCSAQVSSPQNGAAHI